MVTEVQAPLQLATFTSRFIAFSIDMSMGGFFRWVLDQLSIPNIRIDANTTLDTEGIILLVLSFVYFCVIPVVFNGRTLGKALLGIRIVSITDQPLTPLRMLSRNWLGYTVSGLVLGAGFLWALGNEKQQTWHDIGVGTVIISQRTFTK